MILLTFFIFNVIFIRFPICSWKHASDQVNSYRRTERRRKEDANVCNLYWNRSKPVWSNTRKYRWKIPWKIRTRNVDTYGYKGRFMKQITTRLEWFIWFSIVKVGRQLQPSVIFIGGCEKTFIKKAPKGDKTDPKRLKKDLPKILKGFKPEDRFVSLHWHCWEMFNPFILIFRVLLVGTSVAPFDADLKPFVKAYERIILIPRPDYASRFCM